MVARSVMTILRNGLLIFLGLAVLSVSVLLGHRLATRTDLTPRRVRTERLDGGRLELGHAVLRPNLPGNPTVELFFAVPLEPTTGGVRATASTVLFCAPFLNEDRFLKRDGLREEHLQFVRQCGWSLFALAIKGERTVSEDGRQNYYVYPESGWPEVVFAVKAWLEERYGLSSRRLVVVGESSGGSMAEQLAVAYPEKIAAAAWNGGSTYASVPSESPVALFAFNAWGCPGAAASRAMSAQAAAAGVQVLWEEGPPIWKPFDATHHGCSAVAVKLRRLFLKGAMALADESGRVPPAAEWPVSFRQPDGRLLHFPSEEFRDAWANLPLELNAVLREEISARPVLVKPAGLTPTRTVVLFPGELDDVRLRDAVHALNRENCAVCLMLPKEKAADLARQVLSADAAVAHLPVQVWSFDEEKAMSLSATAAALGAGRGVWMVSMSAVAGEEIPGVETITLPDYFADEYAWLEALRAMTGRR